MTKKNRKTAFASRIPANVQLWTTEVLEYMDKKDAELTTKDIADHFSISINNAYVRLTRLRSWGMVRIEKRTRPKTYLITDWGRKFLKDQKGKGGRS